MRAVSRMVTILVLLAIVGGAAMFIRARAGHRRFGGNFVTYARFRDALGLPLGSKVVIAGVQVGEIDGLAIEGRLARVSMRLRDEVVLCDDAFAERKVSSLFGDNYVELSPGGPAESDELPPERRCERGGHRRLVSGEPVPRVIDGDSTDRLLRRIDRSMPKVEQAMDDIEGFLSTARAIVDGPATARLAQADRYLARGGLGAPLENTDRAMDRFVAWSGRAADVLVGSAPTVNARLDSAAQRIAVATGKLHDARAEVADALQSTRAGLDDLDATLADVNAALVRNGAGEPVAADDAVAAAEPSAFGRLVRDPALADRIEEASASGAAFTRGFGRLRSWVGLRTEYNMFARQMRFYVSAEVGGRNDRFYKIELEKGPLGDIADVPISDEGQDRRFVRRVSVVDHFRLTAQWGKRLGWLAVRFGIKDSTFGVGADANFLGGHLKFEADLFGKSYSDQPRLKLAAALHLFRTLYILGGVDDVLSSPGYLPISPWPADPGVPIEFDQFRYGRDYFAGFALRFDERDLNTLLLAYGSILANVL